MAVASPGWQAALPRHPWLAWGTLVVQGAEHPALATVWSLVRPLFTLLKVLGCFKSGPAAGMAEVLVWGARRAP